MAKAKKVNPRRRPASMADVRKAKSEATNEAMEAVLYMVLYGLIDKIGYTPEQIHDVEEAFAYVVDSINQGYVKWQDVRRVLREEYGVKVRFVEGDD